MTGENHDKKMLQSGSTRSVVKDFEAEDFGYEGVVAADANGTVVRKRNVAEDGKLPLRRMPPKSLSRRGSKRFLLRTDSETSIKTYDSNGENTVGSQDSNKGPPRRCMPPRTLSRRGSRRFLIDQDHKDEFQMRGVKGENELIITTTKSNEDSINQQSDSLLGSVPNPVVSDEEDTRHHSSCASLVIDEEKEVSDDVLSDSLRLRMARQMSFRRTGSRRTLAVE